MFPDEIELDLLREVKNELLMGIYERFGNIDTLWCVNYSRELPIKYGFEIILRIM